jgi:predicted TIM-barrel fold metal-dependent hydrolase
MIVDCHTHLHAYPGHLSDGLVAEANARSRGHPLDLHVPPERHWEAMKSVDRAIVFGIRADASGFLCSNDYTAEYVHAHPEKLIGFACVDPASENVHDALAHGIDHLKLRGVKLGPIYQHLHPLDDRMLPVYQFCETRGLPIMIHQGTTFLREAPLKFAHPLQLEDVALKFPDLKLIIAHIGHPWIEDTIVLIRKHPNFLADISALHYRRWQFYNALILAKEYGVFEKLLFGSDYPYTTPEASLESLRNFNRITEGTNLPKLGDQEIESLIQRPILRLLNLE